CSITARRPGPARIATPLPGAPRGKVEFTSAPWVTSGSSPASLTPPARASSSPCRSVARANDGRRPFGRRTSTGSGKCPVTSAVYAAVVAAVAHAPVVQPYRSSVTRSTRSHDQLSHTLARPGQALGHTVGSWTVSLHGC